MILFLFIPLNIKLASMHSTATFDLAKIKIQNVQFRVAVVLAQSLIQYCKNNKLVEMPEKYIP